MKIVLILKDLMMEPVLLVTSLALFVLVLMITVMVVLLMSIEL
jgi:hypothetical protein